MNVTVKQLSRRYDGDVVAVDGVDITFQAGKTTVIVGPSGSGKTTLLNLIAGLLRPTTGSIHFGDRDVTGLPPEDRNIGFVFQSYALFPHMTAEQNVGFGLLESQLPVSQRLAIVDSTMRRFGIEHLRRRRPAELSGGEKQRVALARALARRPAVLLLDEPLSALDAQLRERLRVELRSIFASLDVTTIHVTHDRTEAMLLGESVVVMNAGRVLQHDTPERIYRRPANVFVARFFGDANLIEGQLDGSGTHIDTPLGSFAVAEPGASTGRVVAVIRPEMFAVAPNHAHFTVRVDRADFLGSRWRVEANAERAGRLVIDLPGDTVIAAGESLPLRITRNSVHVIAAEELASATHHEQIVTIR
ncbi:MAG TPA: ABC transporter ATP-binding protein [Thermoanaerobaculia bacterium]